MERLHIFFCLIVLLTLNPQRAFAEYTDRDFIETLEKNPKACNIADVVKLMPASMNLRPATMTGSSSIQTASVLNPRILFFELTYPSPTAFRIGDLIVGMTGPAHGSISKSVEIIQYLPQENRYRFSEVILGCGQPPRVDLQPSSCASCHTSRLEPIWAHYATWPGMLPSIDQFNDSRMVFLNDSEKAQFQRYFTSKPNSPYANITGPANADMTNGTSHIGSGLSVKFANANGRTIFDALMKSNHSEAYRLAFQAAANDCPSIESYVPKNLRQKFSYTYGDILADTVMVAEDGFDRKMMRADYFAEIPEGTSASSINFDVDNYGIVAKLRWLLERNGGSISQWFNGSQFHDFSLPFALKGGTLPKAFGTGCPNPEESRQKLMAAGAAESLIDSGIEDHSTKNDPYRGIGLSTSEFLALETARTACSSCHIPSFAASHGAPVIDFEDAEGLQKYLRNVGGLQRMVDRLSRDSNSPGAMPKNRTMRASTKQQIIVALGKLNEWDGSRISTNTNLDMQTGFEKKCKNAKGDLRAQLGHDKNGTLVVALEGRPSELDVGGIFAPSVIGAFLCPRGDCVSHDVAIVTRARTAKNRHAIATAIKIDSPRLDQMRVSILNSNFNLTCSNEE